MSSYKAQKTRALGETRRYIPADDDETTMCMTCLIQRWMSQFKGRLDQRALYGWSTGWRYIPQGMPTQVIRPLGSGKMHVLVWTFMMYMQRRVSCISKNLTHENATTKMYKHEPGLILYFWHYITSLLWADCCPKASQSKFLFVSWKYIIHACFS